jgi:hypothetical protein
MTLAEAEKLTREHSTVSIWPEAAAILGIKSKNKAYQAARSGLIKVIELGPQLKRVPSTWLRRKVGLDGSAGPEA